MGGDPFSSEVSRHVWESRYRFRGAGVEHTVEDTWRPIISLRYRRRVLAEDGTFRDFELADHALSGPVAPRAADRRRR